MSYTMGPCWVSILNIAVCTHLPQIPNYKVEQRRTEQKGPALISRGKKRHSFWSVCVAVRVCVCVSVPVYECVKAIV